uniref:Pentatricopeptide repeat-containing protein n=1 Tax=Salix viminalis TaxID=40686 RepID=A0A6N2LL25_SALVM
MMNYLRLSKATDTFYDMIRTHHIVPTLPLWNRLIYQFNATGLVSQDAVGFNTLIDGYCKVGEISYAFELMERNEEPSKRGDFDRAKSLIDEILGLGRKKIVLSERLIDVNDDDDGFLPDVVTYGSIINGLCKRGIVDRSKGTFEGDGQDGSAWESFIYQSQMIVCGVSFDLVVCTTLIDGLSSLVNLMRLRPCFAHLQS